MRRYLLGSLCVVVLGCHGAGAGPGTPPSANPPPVASRLPAPVMTSSPATRIASGANHTCLLRADGRVVCWGSNSLGQLGDGSEQDRWAPTPVRGVADAVELSVGGLTACVRAADGAVSCWGGSRDIGGFGSVAVPIAIEGQVAEIAAGHEYACARSNGGEVQCWGNGGAAISKQPSAVEGLPKVRRLVSGDRHSCALDEVGAVWCWGKNDYGQLGDGTHADRMTPAKVAGIGPVTRLWVAGATTFARDASGELHVWGHDGTRDWKDNAEHPRKPTKLSRPALGGAWTSGDERCFLDEAGRVACRQRDAQGQLVGAYAKVDFGGPVRQLAVGQQHACALLDDGVQCFGDNGEGQLGRGSAANGVSLPTPIAGIDDAQQVVTGEWEACALRSKGSVTCWRKPIAHLDDVEPEPKAVPSLAGVTAIHNGGQYFCADGPGAQTRCWGRTTWRPCVWDSPDNCQSEDWPTPGKVAGLAGVAGATQVAGDCVLMPTGKVRCVERYHGGPAQNQPPLQHVAQLAGAAWLHCARHTSGAVTCAFGATVFHDAKDWHRLADISDAIDLSASETHICVLRKNGEVKCTSPTSRGSLCAKPSLPCAKLHDVALPDAAAEVVTGDGFSCARLRDGRVMCWGVGADGVLGDGHTVDRDAPVAAHEITDAVELDGGPSYVCARSRSGQVLCWGRIVAGLKRDPKPAPIRP